MGEVPPLSFVGTLHGGAVTGSHVEPVPPGRATTSVGAGVSKELLHQHLHTAGTVVAAGESPAKGEYGGVGGVGYTTLKFGEGATASVRGRGIPADSESAGETVPADSESAGETGVSGGVLVDTEKIIINCDKASALSLHRKGGSRPSSLLNTLRGEARRAPPISDGPCSGGTSSLKEGSSVAPTPVAPYEGDTARRIGAGVEAAPKGAASTWCANPFHGSTQPPLCGVDAAPPHYFCGEQGHQPPSLPSAGQGKGPQHLAALAPTGARVGRAPSGHLSPAKVAALRGDGSLRQSPHPPAIESTVDNLRVRTETDFKAICTAEISQYVRNNLSPDEEAALREILKIREILIRTPRGREMAETVETTAAEKVAAQLEQKMLQAVTEQAADEAADRRGKEVKGGARRGNKKLTKWVITAEALPRKECARQGCHKKAVFTCGASGPLLCSKSCQHRHKKWGKGERVPELQKGTGSWCAGRHSRRVRGSVRCADCRTHFCTRGCLQASSNRARHKEGCKARE